MDVEKVIEDISLYIFERAINEYASGPLPIVERYSVVSDGEDIRVTLRIAGSTRTYIFPIIGMINHEELFAILEKFYDMKKRVVMDFINMIRLKLDK